MSVSFAVNLNYASPCLHENDSFVFDGTTYLIDRRIWRSVQELFGFLNKEEEFDNIHSSQKRCFVQLFKCHPLTHQVLNLILSFYQKGTFFQEPSEEVREDTATIAQAYMLSFLENYLQSCSENQEMVDEEQLKLAALQQKPKAFYTVLCRLADSKDRETQEFRKICGQALIHFQPETFENVMVNFIHPHFGSIYHFCMQKYAKNRKVSLENALLSFKDKNFKRQCLDVLPPDMREKWFETNSSQSDTLEVIKQNIRIYLNCRNKFFNPVSCEMFLINHLKKELKDKCKLEWDDSYLVTSWHIYLQISIQRLNDTVMKRVKKVRATLSYERRHLHPAFQEDFELLQQLSFSLEEQIRIDLPFLKESSLNRVSLFEELLVQTRYIYCEHYSLAEDFIIQFITTYLQSFIFLSREISSPSSSLSESLVIQLQSKFKEGGFGERLSPEQLEFALYVYIRKSVEILNFKLYYPKLKKVNIHSKTYDSEVNVWMDGETRKNLKALEILVSSEQKEVVDLLEGLTEALQFDFPLDQVSDLTAEGKRLLSDPIYLKKDVFIKLQQAYFRVTTYEEFKKDNRDKPLEIKKGKCDTPPIPRRRRSIKIIRNPEESVHANIALQEKISFQNPLEGIPEEDEMPPANDEDVIQ